MERSETLKQIEQIALSYLNSHKEEFVPGKSKIKLIEPTFGIEEITEAMDSLLSGYVSMGEKVKKFEQMFAEYLEIQHATMVNSGSSANLLALSTLSTPSLQRHIKPGDEIITSAITWATTIYPISDIGAVPVITDVELGTYNIDVTQIEEQINDKTKVIMPVHLLGNPCEIDKIVDLAKQHNLFVIEDACESHGAIYNDKKAGTFGDIGTFSFYISHHITTMEGGMVVTNNDEINELAKSKRAFGWIRDIKNKKEIADKFKQIDDRFLFLHTGFNMRPTELQGAFGIHQIKKLENFIKIRRENAAYWTNGLKKYEHLLILPTEKKNTRHVWYGYPLTIREGVPFTRKDVTDFLEKRGIETRPIMAGNIAEQPVIKHIKHKKINLKNAELIMRNGFFFGNHQKIQKQERQYVLETLKEFLEKKI